MGSEALSLSVAEAKGRLSEAVREARAGRRVEITVHRRPVALIVPVVVGAAAPPKPSPPPLSDALVRVATEAFRQGHPEIAEAVLSLEIR